MGFIVGKKLLKATLHDVKSVEALSHVNGVCDDFTSLTRVHITQTPSHPLSLVEKSFSFVK
jgi:hypothetical protein